MKRHAFWILLSVITLAWILLSCSEEQQVPVSCTTPATLRDLKGLDGCGYVFELSDGTQLEAIWEWGWCGTPPLPQGATEDPLYDFEYADGKQVLIGFEERPDWANACMSARPVKIVCLQEVMAVEL